MKQPGAALPARTDEVFYLDLYDEGGTPLFATNRGVGTIVNDD